jgi:hypothetical protein
MSPWQQDALDLLREARARATETSNITLHQACGQAIEAMASEGSRVPSDLQFYARTVRRLHGLPAHRTDTSVSVAFGGQ